MERGITDEAREGRSSESSRVSFSGLLNAIDGVASQEGRIFFMTTNHIEKLDPALIRPGRCDVKLELKKASKQQMEMMFLRFFPGEDELAAEFASRLPSNELSMATLQGHFLKSGQTGQECIDRIPDLLQSSRPKQVRVMSIYDHLARVGLERYSPLLEGIGIDSAATLATCNLTVSVLETISVELKYDCEAVSMFERLLKVAAEPDTDSSRSFLADEYALADVSTLRESFLAAYPSSYETQHGEKSPFFRRLASHRLADGPHADNCSEADSFHDMSTLPTPPKLHFTKSKSSSVFSAGEGVSGMCVTEKYIDRLGRDFCSILSKNGKGLISLNILRKLLEMYPNKPNECVAGAAAFIGERKVGHMILRPMTLYKFLKRAGLASKIHDFTSNGVSTVEELLTIEGSSVAEKVKHLKDDHNLNVDDATYLAEVLTKTVSTRGSLYNFGLHSRKRIVKTFVMFYYDTLLSEDCPLSAAADVKDTESAVSRNDPCGGTTASTRTTQYNMESLNDMGFTFGMAVTSPRGEGLVSLTEIIIHLRRYSFDPEGAISTVQEELLNPPFPPEPPPPPPARKPTEWVYTWLQLGEIDEKRGAYVDALTE